MQNKDNLRVLEGLKDLPDNIKWHDQNVLNYFFKDWINKHNLHLDYTYGLMTINSKFEKLKPGKETDWPKIVHYIAGQGEKTKCPFINEKMYLQSWCTMPEVIEYYKNINTSIQQLKNAVDFKLPLINVDNIINKNTSTIVRTKTIVPKAEPFTGLPEIYMDDDPFSEGRLVRVPKKSSRPSFNGFKR